jgi:hypothetical protein
LNGWQMAGSLMILSGVVFLRIYEGRLTGQSPVQARRVREAASVE